MLTFAIYFAAGLVGGFCSSVPLGPINLWVTHATLEQKEFKLKWFLGGVIVADVAFAALAIWGYFIYLNDSKYTHILEMIGGLFLIGLGGLNLRSAFSKQKQISRPEPKASYPWQQAGVGLFMCGSNPAFLMYWVFVIEFIDKYFSITTPALASATFLPGVVIGDILWFGLLIWLVRKGRKNFRPKLIHGIRIGIALSITLLGLTVIIRNSWHFI